MVDPLLDMANRVAGLPAAMHQSLDGERVWVVTDWNDDVAGREALREAVRRAILADCPVMGEDRFAAMVDRVVAAVEALGEPEDEQARRLTR